MQTTDIDNLLGAIRRRSLIAAGAGVAVSILGAVIDTDRFMSSYLFAFVFWVNLSLGFLGILLLHHMTSGKWSFMIQRVSEAGTRTIPLMALLVIPLLIGVTVLYPWAHHGIGEEAHLADKLSYLNVPFFVGRTVLYFVLWTGMALLLSRWSLRQDETADPGLTRSLRLLSAPGLIVYVLTATFASVDWVMSLEPEWFSSIFGMLFVVGQVLGALALGVILLRMLSDTQPIADVVAPGHFHDLGNLLLAFVVLWAYMSFSQFLIIWAGNLPEEIPWYLKRLGEGWKVIGLLLVVLHFALPFLLLLSRRAKRTGSRLAMIAGAILVMRAVDMYWVIMPGTGAGMVNWMDIAALVGIGGLWFAVFSWQLAGHPLLPRHDPRFVVVIQPVRSSAL